MPLCDDINCMKGKNLAFQLGRGDWTFSKAVLLRSQSCTLVSCITCFYGFSHSPAFFSSYPSYFQFLASLVPQADTILTPFTKARARRVHVNAFLCHLAWSVPLCKHALAHAYALHSTAMGWSARHYSTQPGLPWDKAHANVLHSPVGAVYGMVPCQPGRFQFLFGPRQQVPPLTLSFSSERIVWKNKKLGLSAPSVRRNRIHF
jgi:hypothetical protein